MRTLKLPIKSFMNGLYYTYNVEPSKLTCNIGETNSVTVYVTNPMNQAVPDHQFSIILNGREHIQATTNEYGYAIIPIIPTTIGLNSIKTYDNKTVHFLVKDREDSGSKVEVFLDTEAIVEGPYAKPAGGSANYGVIVKDEQLMFINIELYLKGWPTSAGLYSFAYLNPSFQYTFNELRERYQMTVSATLAHDSGSSHPYALPGYFSYLVGGGVFSIGVPSTLTSISYRDYTLSINTVLPVVKQ